MINGQAFFAAAWAESQKIYDPVNSGDRVARVVGGYVEKNINNPEPYQRWSNTCAVRMSYILNHTGFIIPKILGQTVSGRSSPIFLRGKEPDHVLGG